MFGWLGTPVPAQVATSKVNLPVRAEFREPVTLASKDGILEVRLTARQGAARLDTVAAPVKNFLLFDYEVIRGTASDGQMSGGSIPALLSGRATIEIAHEVLIDAWPKFKEWIPQAQEAIFTHNRIAYRPAPNT